MVATNRYSRFLIKQLVETYEVLTVYGRSVKVCVKKKVISAILVTSALKVQYISVDEGRRTGTEARR